jgi:Na+-transporting methylmalonyl-CoA/oxaloacetate decarboxylase gamma subunit
MAQSRARRPLCTAEAVMITLLAYLILLISLAATRVFGGHEPTVQALRPVAQTRAAGTATTAAAIAPLNRLVGEATCVGAHTVPHSYASAPGVTEPLAFGPPVEPAGQLSTAAVNGVLIQRLCGGQERAGGPVVAPDRRLFAAIDAAVNGTDPNRTLTQSQWAAGVDEFITRDGRFVDARVETRPYRAGTATFGMQPRPGADPLVIRTRLAHDDTNRYLLLPVRAHDGRVVTLSLRLRCGFQPVFPP